jgi:sulfide:quinone oxidoreductase
LHVVIAGGGVAATEVAFVLREHGGAAVRLTFVAPPAPTRAVVAAADPFRVAPRSAYPLRAVAREVGAGICEGRVVAVDGDRHRVRLGDGRTLAYDALVLATGARPRAVVDGALTLFGRVGPPALERVLAEIGRLEPGAALGFVIPPGVTRALSLYELAVIAGVEARGRHADVRLALHAPERVPLERFGPAATAAAARHLDEAAVAFAPLAGGVPDVERVVALPVLEGAGLPGVPATADGFFPVDELGAVPAIADVFAAGDASACPVKHADVACAQAATIADGLAHRAGAAITPAPWRPTVDEHLLGGDGLGALTHHRAEVSRAVTASLGHDPADAPSPGAVPTDPVAVAAVLRAYEEIATAVRSLGVAAGVEGASTDSLAALSCGLADRGLIDRATEDVLVDLVVLRDRTRLGGRR